jgi:hypothetical protein
MQESTEGIHKDLIVLSMSHSEHDSVNEFMGECLLGEVLVHT